MVAASLFAVTLSGAARAVAPSPQTDLEQLRAELKSRIRSIEDQFAKLRQPPPPGSSERRGVISAPSPAGANLPPDEHPNYDRAYVPGDRESLRQWQAELARRFARAADTVERMLSLNPPDAQSLSEELETLRLYAQPVSSPDTGRTVFGVREVQTPARLRDVPEAAYTPEARAAKARGQVRLRLVLAADGSVRHVFPTRSAEHGLTESAVEAARRITFEPAVRDGVPVSQFLSLVYDFKDGKPAKPFVPLTIF